MFLWGIVIACTAAVKNYPQLIAVRILMGITDAGMPPSLMLMSSQYYRKDEQAMRFAIWFSSVGCAMIAGGLISFGFQFVDSDVMASWSECPPIFKRKNSSLTTHHRNHVLRPRSPQLDSRRALLLETPGLTHDSDLPQRRGKSRINPPRLRQPNRNHIQKIPTQPTPRPLPRPTSLSNFLPHPPRLDGIRNSHRLRHNHHQRLRFHIQRSRSLAHAFRPNRHHHRFSRRLRSPLSLPHTLDNFHLGLQRLSLRSQSSSFRPPFQPRSPTRRSLPRLLLPLHRRHKIPMDSRKRRRTHQTHPRNRHDERSLCDRKYLCSVRCAKERCSAVSNGEKCFDGDEGWCDWDIVCVGDVLCVV